MQRLYRTGSAICHPCPIIKPKSMTVITCNMVADQIDERLSGAMTDEALAAWAFDRFYAVELGLARFEAGAEERIADALDTLMFSDHEAFRLNEEELRRLAALLRMP